MMMLYYQELAIVPILFVCCTVIANPSPELNVSEDRRLHRRRSIVHDPRYLDFKFVVEPKSAVIDESSHALFHCAYTINALDANLVKSSEEAAGADVRIEWRKDGTSVDHLRSSGRIQTLANGSLLIENAGPADEGIYQCAVHVNSALLIASTPWIFLSRRVTLQAPFFDRFDVQPADQSVFPQQKAAFRCLINSKPAAEIEWYKDNSRLKPIESQRILPVSQTLELSDVSKDDAGNYKCVARNGAKTRVSQIGALHVKEDVNEIAGTLSVVLEPRSQVLRAGDSFLLECLVNGFPLPKVTWSHDRVPIVIDARRQLVGRANSSLLVISAQLADAGSYTCRAENGEDIVDLAAAVSIRTMPKIVVAPRDEATQETLDAEFECVAEGVPKPRITWYKNGEVIIPSEYFVIASNRLKVFGLVKDDQGVYQCFAENDVGSAQASAQLLVDAAASHMALTAGVSGAAVAHQRHQAQQPLALKAVNVGSRAISLSWDPPPHSPTIQLYHVFFRMEDSTREKLVNSTTNYVTLSDLQPNTAYVIRIAGESNSGLGKASETIRVLTKREDAVPGRVRNLRGKVLGSETIQVDWDPPSASAGAEAFRYRLFYIKKGAAEDEHETQVLMVKTSYTLHSMEKYTMYNIRVEAEGASGVGPSSDVLELRTFADVPSASPKNVRLEALSPKTVRVRWSPPDIDQRNGEIIGYKIRYKTKRKGSKGNAIIVEGDPGMFIVEGLEPSAHYTFRIAAMTTNGTGIFSDWLGVDTPVEEREETQIAGAPSELRVHAGHDFIEVSWLPPRDDNIMIRGYLIGWGVNIPDIEKTSVDANVRHYTIKGLKPSREYVISLRAFNNIGNGFPIYETVQTAAHSYGRELFHQAEGEDVGDRRVPSRMLAPMGVVAEPVSSSSIRLMWTDPNDGFNQYYTVRYSSGSDNNGNVRQFNTSETEVVVDGLKPNTQYEFAVRLVESSEWSLNAVNRTFASPPSSAPRDLSIFAAHPTVQDEEGTDAVTLSWQPPKYANGEIEEYIVLYSDKLELSDKDWIMDSVKGDRLSMTIHNLIPMLTYYFKIQARNIKGYGPLSPVATYTSRHYTSNDRFAQKGTRIGGVSNVHLPNEAFYTQLGEMLTSNFIYVLIGIVSVVLIFLIVVLAVVCIQRKGSNSPSPAGGAIIKHDYMEGRKYSSSTLSRHNTSQQPDLWIHQQLQQQNSGNRFALLNASSEGGPVEFIEVATPHGGAHDVKRFAVAQHLNATADSPPPRYQTLQDGGTLSRSYHQSSTSLEMARQKTPQILYTGVNRQPIAKVEFASSEHGSYAGSTTMLPSSTNTPPPSSSLNGCCGAPDSHDNSSSYQPLRTLNPLKSFAQMGGAPPPASSPFLSCTSDSHDQRKTAHIVRPVVVASPTLRNYNGNTASNGKPAGIVIGQKSTLTGKLPVGRATAQPRVDVSEGIHSPYSTVRGTPDFLNNNNIKCISGNGVSETNGNIRTDSYENRYNGSNEETKPLKSMPSSEDVDEIENYGIDRMIDTLQQLQQEFTER